MAKKYVDAVLLRDELRELYNWSTCDGEYNGALEDVFDILYNIPSADVQVRHGKWVSKKMIKESYNYGVPYEIFYCSVCSQMLSVNGLVGRYNYCPYCGARMDGEEE